MQHHSNICGSFIPRIDKVEYRQVLPFKSQNQWIQEVIQNMMIATTSLPEKPKTFYNKKNIIFVSIVSKCLCCAKILRTLQMMPFRVVLLFASQTYKSPHRYTQGCCQRHLCYSFTKCGAGFDFLQLKKLNMELQFCLYKTCTQHQSNI